MAGWVASLSVAEFDNWEICKRDHLFGTGSSRGAGVRAGDDVFFWRAQSGLFSYALATGNAETVRDDTYVPWPGRERYRYVWPIEIVAERDAPLPMKWAQLDALAGIGGVPASQLPPIQEDKTDLVRRLFDPAQRLVKIAVYDSLREDLRRITSEYDARVMQQKAITVRQGQGRFRSELLHEYGRRCCITGWGVEPVLEAAHIAPYRGAHTNHVWNGLLLRSDLHTLFDLNEVTVLPDGTIRMSPPLRHTAYGTFDQKQIRRPTSQTAHPDTDVVTEHNARCTWLTA